MQENTNLGELRHVERGAGDEEFELGTESRDVFDEAEQYVGVERALVRLVDDHDTA